MEAWNSVYDEAGKMMKKMWISGRCQEVSVTEIFSELFFFRLRQEAVFDQIRHTTWKYQYGEKDNFSAQTEFREFFSKMRCKIPDFQLGLFSRFPPDYFFDVR